MKPGYTPTPRDFVDRCTLEFDCMVLVRHRIDGGVASERVVLAQKDNRKKRCVFSKHQMDRQMAPGMLKTCCLALGIPVSRFEYPSD